MREGAVAVVLASLARPARGERRPPRPWLVVVPDHQEAERLAGELSFYLGDLPILQLPADDVRPYEGLSPHPAIPRQRLVALDHLERGAPGLVIASARALMHRVLPAELLREHRLELSVRAPAARDALVRRLADWGYLVSGTCDEPGTIAWRGDLVDVWPSGRDQPVRIELFDDEIEDMRELDPATQRSGARSLQRLRVLPAREALITASAISRASERLANAVDVAGTGQRTRRRALSDLREGLWFPGAEDYLPALHGLVAPLSYADQVVVVGQDAVVEHLERFQQLIFARWEAEPPEQRPPVPPAERYVPAREVIAALQEARWLEPFAADAPNLDARDNAALRASGGDLRPIVEKIRGWVDEGWQVVFSVESAARAERLHALLDPYRLRPRRLADGELPAPGALGLWIGEALRGFHSPTSKMAVIGVDELFGQRATRAPPRTLREAAVTSFAQLKVGDLVVHARHGIGRFEGMARLPVQMTEDIWGYERRSKDKLEQDFVIVSYRDADKLYLPVTRLDEIARYQMVGGSDAPKLDKLGGDSWVKRKGKVREKVMALAHELLRAHALRAVAVGHAYEGRPDEYVQFAADFPYVETPDQEAAIEDVLADLAAPEPCDRLIIGDVGFGKTEVAMRAAMRVLLDGYQVAVLCPTTVLAFQHFETFKERFRDVPVNIEMLSRFRSAAETRAVLDATARGGVDILIGTTSILSRDLRFKKLGLVVVDEEHRFGVKQKEKLKKLALEVDYLAMSATPIPRTLHMAIAGLRKVSVIASPPAARQAIRTRVARHNPAHIREEVLHELQRGGQVFFVHNRVGSLPETVAWMRELVPEARVGMAHGQMGAEALEDVLVAFTRHNLNVLVCTAIIEIGVDMPNVNTMLIDRADQFGLAQLYQLRGRVGRGAVRGHCTLLIPAEGGVSAEAMRRLSVLQENTELGSGFAIANADLEQRGAGDLLGESQHGYIEAVGLDTYLELLTEAVAEATGDLSRHRIDPELEIPVPALLPDAYVPELEDRLVEYRRLAVCGSVAAVQELVASWEDRYGHPPPEVLNLGWLAEARARCRDLGILAVRWLKLRVLLDFDLSTRVSPVLIAKLVSEQPGRYAFPKRRVVAGNASGEMKEEPWRLEVRFTPQEAETPFRFLHFIFETLGG